MLPMGVREGLWPPSGNVLSSRRPTTPVAATLMSTPLIVTILSSAVWLGVVACRSPTDYLSMVLQAPVSKTIKWSVSSLLLLSTFVLSAVAVARDLTIVLADVAGTLSR